MAAISYLCNPCAGPCALMQIRTKAQWPEACVVRAASWNWKIVITEDTPTGCIPGYLKLSKRSGSFLTFRMCIENLQP